MKSASEHQRTQAMTDLMKRLGYQFKQPELLILALSHRSNGANNNERLEFLGDSILGFVIGKALYTKFPKVQEGQLSRLRAGLVKGVTLAEVGKELDIGKCLVLGAGERKTGGHRRESIVADAVEAIIGAIYLDSDMDNCEALILNWFNSRLQSLTPDTNQKDAKTRLQEFLQARQAELPIYTLVKSYGKDHNQTFVMSCAVSLLQDITQAEGPSRRIGEQKAATLALEKLQAQVTDN